MGKRGPKKGHGGRPPIKPDNKINNTLVETVEKMAQIQCTMEEVASFINISVKSLYNNEKFLQAYKRGIKNGKSSLRRMQWKGAETGNSTMLVWLGKQYLGQRDKNEVSGKDGGPLQLDFTSLLDKFRNVTPQQIDVPEPTAIEAP